MDHSTLPLWQSHRTVHALKIESVDKVTATLYRLTPTDKRYPPFEVTHVYVGMHQVHAGGYYIVHEDGYVTFKPAKAIEEGYNQITDPLGQKEVKHG